MPEGLDTAHGSCVPTKPQPEAQRQSLREDTGAPRSDASNVVLILGAPRSGTTWLAKIFDSHPSVIYRHEPDAVIPPREFPTVCALEDIPNYSNAAQRYVAQLTTVRQLKSAGTRPVFGKPFQPFAAPVLRGSLALGLRAVESLMPHAKWPRRVTIPDLVRRNRAPITFVIKSVSLLGATALLATAMPHHRIIVIVRHPCGQIASIKRGLSIRTMGVGTMFGSSVLATKRAKELGLTRETYEQMPMLDRWVCGWALMHAKLLHDINQFSNVRLIRYEDLCRNPIEEMRQLLPFVRLPWDPKVSRFISKSTRGRGRPGYFSILRDPDLAANSWKEELPAAEIDAYMRIVQNILPHYAF